MFLINDAPKYITEQGNATNLKWDNCSHYDTMVRYENIFEGKKKRIIMGNVGAGLFPD